MTLQLKPAMIPYLGSTNVENSSCSFARVSSNKPAMSSFMEVLTPSIRVSVVSDLECTGPI